MTWHAVDAVDDAVSATRRFLFPFAVVRWTKLALLVLLMGGGVGTNLSVPQLPDAEFYALPDAAPHMVASVDTGLLVAIGVAGLVVAVLMSVVSLSLRLVFYDALRTNEVRLWTPFKRRLRQAAGLFAFSVLVGVVIGGPFAVTAVASERTAFSVDALSTAALVVGLLGGVLLVAVGVLVLRLTYEFVVPVMVLRDASVVAAWKRFWTTLRASWTQFAVYVVVHFFLALGVSIAEGVVFLLVGGTVVVLAGVALLVAAGVLGGLPALVGTTTGLVALGVVAAVALVTLFVVLLPVRVLTRTYLVSYEVATLGGVDADLALLDPAIDPTGRGTDGGENAPMPPE